MSALTRLREWWKRPRVEVSGAGLEMLRGRYRGRFGEPPERGTREFLEVYEVSPYVRAVAGKVAGEVGLTTWTLTREDTGAEVRDNVLLTLLRKPNPYLSRSAVWRVAQLALDLVGDAFLLKQRNALNVPVALWPIPPHWVAETPTPERPAYRVSWQSWQADIPMSEMLWVHDAAPADPYRRGSGIIRALGDEIETDEYSAKHAKQLFFNRATPEFVVMDEGAGDKEIKIHERAFMQRLQGLWKTLQPYFTNRKLEFWQPQSMNLENLTLVPLRKHERDIQLQCWGMPPEQIGIVENSNRATIEASDYVFQTRLIKPRRDFLAEELTLKLAPEFDDRLVVGFVSTVPEDKTHRLNVMKAAPWAFGETEWREFAGIAGPVRGARLVPLNSYVTEDPLDQTTRPQSGGAAPKEGEDGPEKDEAEKPEKEEDEAPEKEDEDEPDEDETEKPEKPKKAAV